MGVVCRFKLAGSPPVLPEARFRIATFISSSKFVTNYSRASPDLARYRQVSANTQWLVSVQDRTGLFPPE